MIIELPDLDELLGVVIELPTGVVFRNQTCGTACRQSEAEGIFLPLPGYAEQGDVIWQPDNLRDLHGLDEGDVEQFLVENQFDDDFKTDPDRGRLALGGEAWIPVIVADDLPTSSALKQFAGMRGWITYSNSD